MYSSAAKNVPPSRLVITSLPSTATRVVLPIPAPTADDTADAFIDNYEMVTESNKSEDFTLSQKMVHYVGGRIMKEHWSACKAVLAFHAGATTSKLPAMTKAKKEKACLEYYEAAIAALDPAFFNMQWRIFSAMVYTSQFHLELLKEKSQGKTKYIKEQAEAMKPPPLWEYKGKPWLLGLTIKIFRRDPQLAPNVPDVLVDTSNILPSRAERKRQIANERNAKYNTKHNKQTSENDGVVVKVEKTSGGGGTNQHPHKKILWASVGAAKAAQETVNIAKRVGQMEELNATLDFLERIFPVIGLQPGGDTVTVTTCNDDSSSLHLSLSVRDQYSQFEGISQFTSAFSSGSNGNETTTPVALQGNRTAGSSQNHRSTHSSGSSLGEDEEDGLAYMPLVIPPGAPPDAGGGSLFLHRLFTTGGTDPKGAGAGAW